MNIHNLPEPPHPACAQQAVPVRRSDDKKSEPPAEPSRLADCFIPPLNAIFAEYAEESPARRAAVRLVLGGADAGTVAAAQAVFMEEGARRLDAALDSHQTPGIGSIAPSLLPFRSTWKALIDAGMTPLQARPHLKRAPVAALREHPALTAGLTLADFANDPPSVALCHYFLMPLLQAENHKGFRAALQIVPAEQRTAVLQAIFSDPELDISEGSNPFSRLHNRLQGREDFRHLDQVEVYAAVLNRCNVALDDTTHTPTSKQAVVAHLAGKPDTIRENHRWLEFIPAAMHDPYEREGRRVDLCKLALMDDVGALDFVAPHRLLSMGVDDLFPVAFANAESDAEVLYVIDKLPKARHADRRKYFLELQKEQPDRLSRVLESEPGRACDFFKCVGEPALLPMLRVLGRNGTLQVLVEACDTLEEAEPWMDKVAALARTSSVFIAP